MLIKESVITEEDSPAISVVEEDSPETVADDAVIINVSKIVKVDEIPFKIVVSSEGVASTEEVDVASWVLVIEDDCCIDIVVVGSVEIFSMRMIK